MPVKWHYDWPVNICWLYESRLKKPPALDSNNRARNSTPVYIEYFYNNLDKTLDELGLHDCPERENNMDVTGSKQLQSRPSGQKVCHIRQKRAKPTPSGHKITGDQYVTEINELDNENSLQKPRDKGKNAAKKNVTITTLPPLSGIFKESEPENEDGEDEIEVCRVCQQRQPPTFHDRRHIKLLKWGQYRATLQLI
ncbi:hypothetical protein DPMN_104270 [Dreissena polymorpha]|uniref:Uncharacterized protein n=1 Tax=Dreissena polymorpha TaxID=45954 RepID=A0A9D4HCR2_DREPO|nr:hypothetical protein DPMN_104270 [Dreissena polymorpha]